MFGADWLGERIVRANQLYIPLSFCFSSAISVVWMAASLVADSSIFDKPPSTISIASIMPSLNEKTTEKDISMYNNN